MFRKPIYAMLLSLLLLLGAATAQAQPSEADALFERYPNPGFTLAADPLADPLLMLANRENRLPKSFKPDVETPSVLKKRGADIDLQPEAAAALERMFEAAKAEGLSLSAISGYRSYRTQSTIYARSVERNGQEKADRMSAPPGASEHQLGLAMDLSCPALYHDLTSKFSRKPEGRWVESHCAEYGFILRYREAYIPVTGYQSEPWHIRYVGPSHAALIAQLDVPLETYRDYLALVWQAQGGVEDAP